MKQKAFNKSEKRLMGVSLGAIILLVGVAWWRGSINAEPRITFAPQPAAPDPNGFDVYVQAAKMIATARPAVDRINDPNPPTDAKVEAQQYALARREAWLKQNAAGFALFQKALALPCLFPALPAGGFYPSYGKLRELARSKRIESNTRVLRGDWNGAMQSRIDVAQMGNDTARGGVLISALVGIAIQAIGRIGVEQEIDHLDAAQARRAARRLETIYARRISMPEIMQTEKYYISREIVRMMRESQWRNSNRWGYGLDRPTLQDRLRMATVSKQAVIDNHSAIMDAIISNAQLPYAAPQKPLPAPDNPVTRANLGFFTSIRWHFARSDAGNAMWLVALALRAYQREHKTLPPTLGALVPGYLREIPADPFGGGEPLHFRRDGNSYVLWSVGPDSIDNGGQPITSKKPVSANRKDKRAMIAPDSKGDYVWSKNR